MVAQSILEGIANHAVVLFAGATGLRSQELSSLRKSVGTVEVISIHHAERLVHYIAGCKQSMCRTPRLHATLRHAVTLGQIIQALECVIYLNLTGKASTDLALKRLLKILTNNEYNLTETGADSIIHGIVENNFTVGTHGVQLFKATVTAAHTCCENKKCRFHDKKF